jgi:hypothetical protein
MIVITVRARKKLNNVLGIRGGGEEQFSERKWVTAGLVRVC